MKSKLSFAGLVVACAACCAPLLVPLLAGTGLMAGVAFVSFDALAYGAIAAVALGMVTYWFVARKRKRAQSGCGCETSCDASGAGRRP